MNLELNYLIDIPVNNFKAKDISNNMATTLIKFTEHFENEKYEQLWFWEIDMKSFL